MNPKSFIGPKIRPIERVPLRRVNGEAVWHGVTPTRFVTPLPPVQNPVRARAVRASKDKNLLAVDPFGTPQLAAQVPPARNSGR